MNQGLGRKLAIFVALTCLSGLSLADSARPLRLAAGDQASGSLALATVLGEAITRPGSETLCRAKPACQEPQLLVLPQVSGSAAAALAKLRSGGVDLALVPDVLAYAAYSGISTRRYVAMPQLRTLALVSPKPLFILIRGDASPAALSALAGWRIAMGPRGSDISDLSSSLLGAMGLPQSQYNAVSSSLMDSPAALIRSGRADAVAFLATELGVAEQRALQAGEVKLLNFAKSELERAVQAYPFLPRKVVQTAAGNYATVLSGSVLAARADLPPVLVTGLLTRLWLTPRAGLSRDTATENLPAPLHSAAERFYNPTPNPTETSRAQP